jgi:uncharacterized protein (DUF1684 family)
MIKDEKVTQCVVASGETFVIKTGDIENAILCFAYDGKAYKIIKPKSGLRQDDKSYGETFTSRVIHLDRYVFAMYSSGVIIMFDKEHPARKHFAGKEYYPIDFRWRLEGELTPALSKKTIQLPTSRGLMKSFRVYGTADLTINGAPVTITLYQGAWQSEDSKELFFPFTDKTSGHETYGAGRYIDLHVPEKDQPLVVDFNTAYYPLCFFSPHYNCPVPPAENKLAAAITAGEKGVTGVH